MEPVALKRSEYWGYVAGSVLLGGMVLAPLIFFYLSRLIVTEFLPTFSQVFFASLFLSVMHVASLDRISGEFNFFYFLKMVVVFNLLALAAYYGSARQESVTLLLPGVLSIVVYWVCGEFVVALVRVMSNKVTEDVPSASTRSKLWRFSGGMSVLLGFVITGSFLVDSEQFFVRDAKPILIRSSFDYSLPRREIASIYGDFESQALALPEVKMVNARVGVAPESNSEFANRYGSELSIEITLHEEWQTKIAKKEIAGNLKKMLYQPGLINRLVAAIEPPVPVIPENGVTELKFIPDQTILQAMNLKAPFVSEQITSLIRLAPNVLQPNELLNLGLLTKDGNIIPIKEIGRFELVLRKLKTVSLAPGNWREITLTEEKAKGYLIELSLNRLYQFGLSVSQAEEIIDAAMEHVANDFDQQSIVGIPLAESFGEMVKLGDIASVHYVDNLKRQNQKDAKSYRIQWVDKY